MVVNIDFSKNESKANPPAEKESRPTPESFGITKPELKKAFEHLQSKKDNNEKMTVKEQLRLGRLKKHGDSTQNLASITGNKPTQSAPLAKLNENDGLTESHNLQRVVNNIYNGCTLIQACEMVNISPKRFLQELEKTQNFAMKRDFLNARIILAEYYLERRESLERDLKSGKIDPSTYTCLSSDYKYLAGKLAPLAYGDKIRIESEVFTHNESAADSEKIAELNKMIVDASYTVEK